MNRTGRASAAQRLLSNAIQELLREVVLDSFAHEELRQLRCVSDEDIADVRRILESSSLYVVLPKQEG